MEKMEARVACLKMAVEVAPEIRRTEISAGADKYAGKDMVVIMHIAHSFEEFTHTGKIPEGLILEKLEITPEMLAITKRILQLLEQRSK